MSAIIISRNRIRVLQVLVVSSWVLAALGVTGAVQVLRVQEDRRTERLEALEAQLKVIQAQQEVINSSHERMTRLQGITADLLTTWGSYVRDRLEVAQQNQRGLPVQTLASKGGSR